MECTHKIYFNTKLGEFRHLDYFSVTTENEVLELVSWGWVRSDKNIYSCSIRYYVHTFCFWNLQIENFMYSIHKYWYWINLDQYQNCVLRVRPNHSYIYLISRNETITWDSVLKCGWIIRWVNKQNDLFYWYLI